MLVLLLASLVATAPVAAEPSTPELALRRLVAETAVRQARRIDPDWEERAARLRRPGAVRLPAGLRGAQPGPRLRGPVPRRARGGRPTSPTPPPCSAGASRSWAAARPPAARIRSGDLAAFAREDDGGPIFHLMLLVVPDDPAHAPALVVYHPGEPGAAVRMGRLDDLARDAPAGWRPVPENPLFLGFYRFKEWTP